MPALRSGLVALGCRMTAIDLCSRAISFSDRTHDGRHRFVRDPGHGRGFGIRTPPPVSVLLSAAASFEASASASAFNSDSGLRFRPLRLASASAPRLRFRPCFRLRLRHLFRSRLRCLLQPRLRSGLDHDPAPVSIPTPPRSRSRPRPRIRLRHPRPPSTPTPAFVFGPCGLLWHPHPAFGLDHDPGFGLMRSKSASVAPCITRHRFPGGVSRFANFAPFREKTPIGSFAVFRLFYSNRR